MKFFNTAGPVNMAMHYKIAPLTRWDIDEILFLIEQRKYFILHAPRQTGKTSCLLALRDYLNNEGKYHCVYTNFEAGQSARNDVDSGMGIILSELHNAVKISLNIAELPFSHNDILSSSQSGNALNSYLKTLSQYLDKPLLLLIDEIDALIGDTLISVLRQLRSSYPNRPENFPQSVILCGVRDIKDYRIHRSDGEIITGGSCFNIKAKSLTLGNFSKAEVHELYHQHTTETGQQFSDEIFPLVMRYTNGQPWLVNALGYEVTHEMKENRDPAVLITTEIMEEAKERLVLSRATHLDQLADKLKEPRVRRVVEPLLTGDNPDSNDDDVEYCIDLGLIIKEQNRLVVANDIYKEVMPRELTNSVQRRFAVEFTPEWLNNDGSLNAEKLLTMFAEFWRENGEIWGANIAGYTEAAPHLVFQGFLQRVANGNGRIYREYALGMKRCDLMLKWHSSQGEQRIVIELKIFKERDSYQKLKNDALRQSAEYAEKCNATETHIVIFDRMGKTDWHKQSFRETANYQGREIFIWGL
jgi:hypothetical protein